MNKFRIEHKDGRIYLHTPYHPRFVTKIKKAGAKWDGSTWSMDEKNKEVARQIMLDVYGCDDRFENPFLTHIKKCSVKITVKKDLYASRGPVTMLGRIIASAKGRDSGAKIGDDVCFEKGGATSWGSVKNWNTKINAGSVIILHDVPTYAIENKIDFGYNDEDIDLEIIPSQSKADPRQELLEEKERLLARLAEIEQLLAD